MVIKTSKNLKKFLPTLPYFEKNEQFFLNEDYHIYYHNPKIRIENITSNSNKKFFFIS